MSTGRHSPASANGSSLNTAPPSLFGNYFQQNLQQQQLSGTQPAPLFPPPTSSSSAAATATSSLGAGGIGSALSNAGNLQILHFLDGLRSTLRSNGYGETAIVEIVQAMQTLAKYNVLGLGLGLGLAALSSKSTSQQESDYPALNPLAFGHKESVSFSNGSSNKYVASFTGFESSNLADRSLSSDFYIGQTDARSELSAVIQQLTASRGDSSPERRRDLPSLGYVSRSNLRGGGDQSPRGDNDRMSIGDRLSLIKEYRLEGDKLELSVPDSLVGAILGRQARNLMEIQRYSGAKVEVSKREPNSTSTTERIISIEGQPEEIKAARRKIESVIIEEQYKRDNLRKY
uniref:K Homology domain-containing protein n=1 Tax=Romanomermis culicivorax TaxID=13658 RepID=A0A915ILH2_ROMCU